jgi:hypothetical protein
MKSPARPLRGLGRSLAWGREGGREDLLRSDVEQSSLEVDPPEITDFVVELGPPDRDKMN